MYDNHVIVNDHISLILSAVAYFVGLAFISYLLISTLRRAAHVRAHGGTLIQGKVAHGGVQEALFEIDNDEEPISGSLAEELRPRNAFGYVLLVLLSVVFVVCISGLISSISSIAQNGITTKSFDSDLAVHNIEEKYNLTAVELVDDSEATNANRTKLKTDSPEFVGIYNGNTVVHFVVAFQENSGEPYIAVVPPSDGITATQIERSTSKNEPGDDTSNTSGDEEDGLLEALSE